MLALTRRGLVAGVAAAVLVSSSHARSEGVAISHLEELDSRANTAFEYMRRSVPQSEDLIELSAGMLIIPLVTKAALGLGGAYGEGVLRVDGRTVDYFNSVQFNLGLQISAQQYSYVLFFMNRDALDRFLLSDGWKLGAEMKYLLVDDTELHRIDTLTRRADVAGLVFGATGLHVGAALEGTKFTRLNSEGDDVSSEGSADQ